VGFCAQGGTCCAGRLQPPPVHQALMGGPTADHQSGRLRKPRPRRRLLGPARTARQSPGSRHPGTRRPTGRHPRPGRSRSAAAPRAAPGPGSTRQAGGRHHGPFGLSRTPIFPNGQRRALPVPVTAPVGGAARQQSPLAAPGSGRAGASDPAEPGTGSCPGHLARLPRHRPSGRRAITPMMQDRDPGWGRNRPGERSSRSRASCMRGWAQIVHYRSLLCEQVQHVPDPGMAARSKTRSALPCRNSSVVSSSSWRLASSDRQSAAGQAGWLEPKSTLRRP
jgi:hypothetical protein